MKALLILLAATAIALAAWSQAKAATCTAPTPTGQIRLDHPGIVDGDTFRASGQRYRIWGVDTPERGQPGYAEAGRVLQSLTREVLKCNLIDVDRYGRPVVQCFNRRGDVARQLVEAGAAKDMPRYSRGFYGEGCKS